MTNRASIIALLAGLMSIHGTMGASLFQDQRGGVGSNGPGKSRRRKYKPSHFANRGRRGSNRARST